MVNFAQERINEPPSSFRQHEFLCVVSALCRHCSSLTLCIYLSISRSIPRFTLLVTNKVFVWTDLDLSWYPLFPFIRLWSCLGLFTCMVGLGIRCLSIVSNKRACADRLFSISDGPSLSSSPPHVCSEWRMLRYLFCVLTTSDAPLFALGRRQRPAGSILLRIAMYTQSQAESHRHPLYYWNSDKAGWV